MSYSLPVGLRCALVHLSVSLSVSVAPQTADQRTGRLRLWQIDSQRGQHRDLPPAVSDLNQPLRKWPQWEVSTSYSPHTLPPFFLMSLFFSQIPNCISDTSSLVLPSFNSNVSESAMRSASNPPSISNLFLSSRLLCLADIFSGQEL